MTKPLLIVVDDEPAIGEVLAFVAEDVGVEILVTISATAFQKAAKERGPDIVFMDLVLPGSSASALISWMAANKVSARVVLMSGYSEDQIRSVEDHAKKVGVPISGILNKPFELHEAEALLRKALPA